ncbi:MAG: hypothetical protein ACQESP_00810 [Candidatus Muiribacteriota bacterium]
MSIKIKLYIFFLFFFTIVSLGVTRFETASFYFLRELNLNNFSQSFSLKERTHSNLDNSLFVINQFNEDIISKFGTKFILQLFEGEFFLEVNNNYDKVLISSLKPKYSRQSSFLDYYKYAFHDKGAVFFLHLSDNINYERRNYKKLDHIEALRRFFLKNSEVEKDKNKVVLILDTNYFNFRQICNKIDFLDFIINKRDFDTGFVENKRVFNLTEDLHKVTRLDFLFGPQGYLSMGVSDINLKNEAHSEFINRLMNVWGE